MQKNAPGLTKFYFDHTFYFIFHSCRVFFVFSQHKALLSSSTLNGHYVVLEKKFIYGADPATYLASNSFLWTLFSSENSLCIKLWGKQTYLSLYYYLIDIVNVKIQSLNFFSKTT